MIHKGKKKKEYDIQANGLTQVLIAFQLLEFMIQISLMTSEIALINLTSGKEYWFLVLTIFHMIADKLSTSINETISFFSLKLLFLINFHCIFYR